MSYNTDVCDHGPVAVGVAPDHQAAVGVDVIVLSISAGGAEVGADRGSHFHVLENFFEMMLCRVPRTGSIILSRK